MKDLKIEYRKLTANDFSKAPECFKQDFPEDETLLIRHDNCGMILKDNGTPHYYFHNMNDYSSRWAGFISLGNGPFSLQKGVHSDDIAQSEPLSEYKAISGEPLTYGVHTIEGISMEFTYHENGCTFKEGENGSVLDVKGEWFPYGLICHMGSEYNIPFIHLPVHLTGTYEGRPVEFLACIDRIYSPKGKEQEIIKNATSYISSYCSGIRKDGRREWFMGLICNDNGQGLGIYYIDGEEPVISDQVINDGLWERLPYVNDGTVVSVNNIWKFGGKEFHVNGYYGAKGFTAEPRFDRHGQSQVFGSWYVGSEPYEHRIWNTFSENMDAYEDNMKKRGFKVKL